QRRRVPAGGRVAGEGKGAEGTRLAEASGSAALRCWSAHHQGVNEVGEGLAPVGWSDDGLVEALERDRGWMLAVQWHPERTAADDPTQQALFDALVAEAGRPSASTILYSRWKVWPTSWASPTNRTTKEIAPR